MIHFDARHEFTFARRVWSRIASTRRRRALFQKRAGAIGAGPTFV